MSDGGQLCVGVLASCDSIGSSRQHVQQHGQWADTLEHDPSLETCAAFACGGAAGVCTPAVHAATLYDWPLPHARHDRPSSVVFAPRHAL